MITFGLDGPCPEVDHRHSVRECMAAQCCDLSQTSTAVDAPPEERAPEVSAHSTADERKGQEL